MKRKSILLEALFGAVLIALATALWEPFDRRLEAWQSAEAARLYAPYQRFYDETDLFRREVRSANPNPSLVPRARALLTEAEHFTADWNYGNAVHYGNLFLGEVALRQDNIVEARVRLLNAGRTPGSPQLDDYGPDMTLADHLLEQGDSATVLEYFKECQRFWLNQSRNRLADWSQSVRAGRRPDFGKRSGRFQWPPNSSEQPRSSH